MHIFANAAQAQNHQPPRSGNCIAISKKMYNSSERLPVGRFLLGGLLTGIIAAVLVLVYNVIYRRESDFYTFEIVMPFTIFLVFPLFELLCGGVYYLFAGHLRKGRQVFTTILILLTIASVIGTAFIDNSHQEMILRGFRGLLMGIEVIAGLLAALLIPYFVHHSRMYMTRP